MCRDTVLTSFLVLLLCAACDDDGEGGSDAAPDAVADMVADTATSDTGDADAPPSTAACEANCSAQAAPGCENFGPAEETSCIEACPVVREAVAPECRELFDAFAACSAAQTYVCPGPVLEDLSACEDEGNAFTACTEG